MILSACPNGKCRCWCSFLAGESQHELELKSDQTPVPSRFADLVASNDVPLDIDTKHCRSMLRDVREDIKILDGRINEVERVLSALKDIKEKKASQARSYCSVLSPVRRLPFEILSKIFCEACPTLTVGQYSLELGYSLDRKQPPWTLTEVSANWRQVAISISKLWSTICITYRWKGVDSHLLRLQLRRSNPSLLTVAITVNLKLDWAFPKLLAAELFPSSSRWETLCLQDTDIDPHFGPIKGNLPALHTLYYDKYPPGPTTVFAAAPKLRTLYIAHVLDVPHGLSISQITNISTIYFDPSNHLDCLAQYGALERCSLRLFIGKKALKQNVILPNLRVLELEIRNNRDLANILVKLILPALQVLKLTGVQTVSAPLSSLIRRSQCTLEALDVRHASDILELCIVLEELPSLESLTLPTTTVIAAELAKRHDLVPSLRFLHFVNWQGGDSDLYLLQFIKDARPGLETVNDSC